MIIRPEQPCDVVAIRDLTYAAFLNHPVHAPGALPHEHILVDALRTANALTISLVATIGEEVVGHIAFSPVNINNAESKWYGIGPLSVLPAKQRAGIGSALVRRGIELLKETGAHGCVLVGDPAYYIRFGFRALPALTLADIPPEYFQCLALCDDVPTGAVTFHKAFSPN